MIGCKLGPGTECEECPLYDEKSGQCVFKDMVETLGSMNEILISTRTVIEKIGGVRHE